MNIRELTIGTLGLSIPLVHLFSQYYIFGDSSIDFGTIPKEISEQYQLIEYVKIFMLMLISILGFKMVFNFSKHNTLLSKKQILTINISSVSAIILSLTLFLGFNFIDPIFIIPLIYITSIGTFSTKNDSFISFLLTITLIINIVSIFLK